MAHRKFALAHAPLSKRKKQEQVVQEVNRKLATLEKEFGETADAVENGDIDLEDLAWESFGGDEPPKRHD